MCFYYIFFFLIWMALDLWVDAKMAPRTNKRSRTDSHQPSRLTCLLCGLCGRITDLLPLVALPVWPLKLQVSLSSVIPELLLPLICCVTLEKPVTLSGPLFSHLLNKKLEVDYLRGPLISP